MIVTREEAVDKCVEFWVEKSFKTPLNQNNGDDSMGGGYAYVLMNTLSMSIQDDITEDQIEKFSNKLRELYLDLNEKSAMVVDVDYDPHPILRDACDHADINIKCLPIKSNTYIIKHNDNDFRAFGKFKYGSQVLELK